MASPGSSSAPAPAAGGTHDACTAQGRPAVEPGTIRMLNRREYTNTVRDLLGLSATTVQNVTAAFPPDARVVFDTDAAALTASPVLVEQHVAAATALATAANLSMLSPCAISSGSDACAADFIQKFGRRAFRRPLDADEVALFQGVYTRARTSTPPHTFDESLRLVIQTFLQAGPFIYRAETSATPTGGIVRLGAYETASRLSYFLWASMPDEALFAAAADGSLANAAGVEAQARRMIADPKARAVVTAFHRQWLQLDQMDTVTKVATVFPSGSAFPDYGTASAAFIQETEKYTDTVFWEAQGKISRYLVSDVTTAEGKLVQHYGTGAATQRFGLLTQASLLSHFSNPDRTSPTRRGAFVRQTIMCQPVPPAPADVPPLPVVTGRTMRERLEQHRAVPACAACHSLIDPLGLGLESYDTVGRYRATEAGTPVDDSGSINGMPVTVGARDASGAFKGARELSERLAGSAELRDCVARQWFHFAIGRREGELDACTMARIQRDLDGAGGRPSELLAAIARSDAMLYINTEKLP